MAPTEETKMITPLTITSLNQGKLYGEKPAIEELDAHGAIIHKRETGAQARKLPAWMLPVWRTLFAEFAGKVR
jgi:hypothetical protein